MACLKDAMAGLLHKLRYLLGGNISKKGLEALVFSSYGEVKFRKTRLSQDIDAWAGRCWSGALY